MYNNTIVYFGYILRIEIMFGLFSISFFGILNISGSIRYLFKFEFSSDKTHNPKYHKRISISISVGFRLVRIHFYRIGFGSDFRVQFIFSALHFFFLNINFTLCLKFKYINFIAIINYLFYFY